MKFLALLVFTLVASPAEVSSIGAVLPFLGVLTAPDEVFAQPDAQPLMAYLSMNTPQGRVRETTEIWAH